MSTHGKVVHPGNALNRDYLWMMVPLLLMSFFYFGPRVLLLALLAVVTAKVCDRIAAVMRSRKYDPTENSSIPMALIIVMMFPANIRFRVVVAAVAVAVLVGKEAFGGYRSYPFNPSAVGFCIAAVSWPDEVFHYSAPTNWLLAPITSWEQLLGSWRFTGAALYEGASQTLRAGGLPKIDILNMVLGNYAGPLGATCSVVIVACGIYLFIKKQMRLAAPLCYLAVVAVVAFAFPRYTELSWQTFPEDLRLRLQVTVYEMLSGLTPFCAVFLVCEPGTLPHNTLSRVIYGLLLGFAAMMFRYFGNYELGTCFGFLIVNAISGYFDRAIAKGVSRRKGVAPG